MPTLIKEFADGTKLEYDQGAFDSWCVYLTRSGQPRYAPKDIQYFQQLIDFADKYSTSSIYVDFVTIFHMTDKHLKKSVLAKISSLADKYQEDSLEINILYCIIYAGMVAEENKEHTRLGKRVKRLGIHQVLFEDFPPDKAANFSKGKPWRDIEMECFKRGF